MYKIIENNQIIDVMKNITYVKYLPNSKRTININRSQANGCVSSSGNEIYHIQGTVNNFPDRKRTVRVEEINQEEYNKLTTQLKENEEMANKIKTLEEQIKILYKMFNENLGQSV